MIDEAFGFPLLGKPAVPISSTPPAPSPEPEKEPKVGVHPMCSSRRLVAVNSTPLDDYALHCLEKEIDRCKRVVFGELQRKVCQGEEIDFGSVRITVEFGAFPGTEP